ncbi:MAG TPA: TIGR03435 family protein [Bryobacteraceae bacterium]|jgi:uncharacterized protein (TIGR03435 family)
MIRAARLVFCLLPIASFSGGLEAQSCGTFAVASVKLDTSGAAARYPAELASGGRRFTATNQFMVELIMSAYDVSPLQISGIPSAFSGERYDIEATCEQPMAKEQLPNLLQALLAERFHLSVHRELKEQPVYALILGKGAPKLHGPSQEGGKPSLRQSDYSFTFTNAAMSDLVGVLSQVTGRKVLDRTGLHGQYDFTLSYTPDRGGAGRDGLNVSPAADSFPESVFTALREQLGLNLESQKSQVEFIVIDRLDRLIPN